jgi:hypothetical protein
MLACCGFGHFTAFRFQKLAPENPPPTKAVETAPQVDKEERARKRIVLFRNLFRGREDVYTQQILNAPTRTQHRRQIDRRPTIARNRLKRLEEMWR